MVPKFETNAFSSEAILLCPACGFNYLHHQYVDVYARSEDAGKGLHVRTNSGDSPDATLNGLCASEVNDDLRGNPSGRRGGIAIHFWCEGCEARPVLTIAQHKGQTFVEIDKE